MTLQYYSGNRIEGLSTDTKPTTAQDKSVFYETDTSKTFDFDLSTTTWTERTSGVSTLSGLTIDTNKDFEFYHTKNQFLGDKIVFGTNSKTVTNEIVSVGRLDISGSGTLTVSGSGTLRVI